MINVPKDLIIFRDLINVYFVRGLKSCKLWQFIIAMCFMCCGRLLMDVRAGQLRSVMERRLVCVCGMVESLVVRVRVRRLGYIIVGVCGCVIVIVSDLSVLDVYVDNMFVLHLEDNLRDFIFGSVDMDIVECDSRRCVVCAVVRIWLIC